MATKASKSKAPTRSNADDANRILAFLCYLLWPVALVLLLLEKREGDLRYHEINALGFGLAWWIVGSVAGWVLWPIAWLVWLLGLVYAIVLGAKAYNGEKPEIPVVTDLLRKNVKGF